MKNNLYSIALVLGSTLASLSPLEVKAQTITPVNPNQNEKLIEITDLPLIPEDIKKKSIEDKIDNIWNYIINNFEYIKDSPDYAPNPENILINTKDTFNYVQKVDETIIRRKGDCKDLSLLGYHLMTKEGIDCDFCIGKVGENGKFKDDIFHAWIKIGENIYDSTIKKMGTKEQMKNLGLNYIEYNSFDKYKKELIEKSKSK